MTAFRRPGRSSAVRLPGAICLIVVGLLATSCTKPAATTGDVRSLPARPSGHSTTGGSGQVSAPGGSATTGARHYLSGMPLPLSATDVYAADRPGMLSPTVRGDRQLVYVPNTLSDTVSVIDPTTMRVIDTFPVGREPQHIVPSYDLKTLYVTADYVPRNGGPGQGSLTPIDPKTGKPGKAIPIDDPYNLYFTPNGKFGIVVAEARRRLDFYDPHSWQLVTSLHVPQCDGVDHMDFSADGRTLLASCEFADSVIAVDVSSMTLLRTIKLPRRSDGMPQDVKLSPDGRVFYVADMMADGVYLIDGNATAVIGFLHTGHAAHGLYVDRTSTRLFVTNRLEGSIAVIDLRTRKVAEVWRLPGETSPDMGNLSADGKVFWVSGRYHNRVYAVSTVDGHLIASIPVEGGPHGLCVWPQPGRYSLGHTGIMR